MFGRNHVMSLLIGLPLLLSPAANPLSAQDCGCKAATPATPATKKEVKKTERQRQKPSAYPEPVVTRSIAPRDLPDVYASEAHRAYRAARVLHDFRGIPEEGIANWLLDDAKAIAVIPGVKKAAFGFGVRWGRGLLSLRDERTGLWIPPSFIEITGGNFGFQAGIQSTDLVLIFTNQDAVNALLRGKLTLNADASAAAGPVGRMAAAGVPILINSGILTYSRSKGLFAGVSLDGAAITIDDTSNSKVYGKYISGDEILMARRVTSNEVVAPFMNALEGYSASEAARAANNAAAGNDDDATTQDTNR